MHRERNVTIDIWLTEIEYARDLPDICPIAISIDDVNKKSSGCANQFNT